MFSIAVSTLCISAVENRHSSTYVICKVDLKGTKLMHILIKSERYRKPSFL